MNIYTYYLKKISNLIKDKSKDLGLSELNNLKNINLESPPANFDYDLSSNLCLVFGKSNNLNPLDLANKIKSLLLEKITDFKEIEVAGPGFINIRLSDKALISIINEIFNNEELFGSKKRQFIL